MQLPVAIKSLFYLMQIESTTRFDSELEEVNMQDIFLNFLLKEYGTKCIDRPLSESK